MKIDMKLSVRNLKLLNACHYGIMFVVRNKLNDVRVNSESINFIEGDMRDESFIDWLKTAITSNRIVCNADGDIIELNGSTVTEIKKHVFELRKDGLVTFKNTDTDPIFGYSPVYYDLIELVHPTNKDVVYVLVHKTDGLIFNIKYRHYYFSTANGMHKQSFVFTDDGFKFSNAVYEFECAFTSVSSKITSTCKQSKFTYVKSSMYDLNGNEMMVITDSHLGKITVRNNIALEPYTNRLISFNDLNLRNFYSKTNQ